MACSVCCQVESFDPDETNEDNALLKCKKCDVIVHELCYGERLTKKTWICSFCQSDDGVKRSSIRKCQLCPSKKGALKKTETGLWVHVICALFHPNCTFMNVQKMEPIRITILSRTTRKKSCCICKQTIGACVNCNAKRCSKYMHVTCAQSKNLLREENNGGSLDFKLYCDKHIQKEPATRLSFSSINKNVRSRYSGEQLSDVNDEILAVPVPIIGPVPPPATSQVFVASLPENQHAKESIESSSPDEDALHIVESESDNKIVGSPSRDDIAEFGSEPAALNIAIEHVFPAIIENMDGEQNIYRKRSQLVQS